MRLVVLVALAGCGRWSFDETSDASPDTAPDTAPDTVVASTRCDWSHGPPALGTAHLVPELSMPDSEYDPFLVPGDPLTINYVARIGNTGDLLTAHRATVDDPWGTPVVRTDLSTPNGEEAALALEPGGTHGYYQSNHDGPLEIYEVGGTPLAPIRLLDELGTTAVHGDPWPFDAGHQLAFYEEATPSKILFASRATTTGPFTNVAEAPWTAQFAGGAAGATLTGDGLTIVFSASTVPDASPDVYYATRASLADPWSTPALVTAMSSAFGDREPSIRDDGCELFFSRDTGPGTKWDIWTIRVP